MIIITETWIITCKKCTKQFKRTMTEDEIRRYNAEYMEEVIFCPNCGGNIELKDPECVIIRLKE